MNRRLVLAVMIIGFLTVFLPAAEPEKGEKRYLYVVCPGIRNLLEFGGAGILVFDIDKDHAFVKRIDTLASLEEKPNNIKGVCACAATKRLYFTTTVKLYCVDLVTEKTLWEKALPQGTDRMSITPDGKVLYVPSFEKDIWNVVDGASGDVITSVETKSGAHNTVCGLDGSRMYLAGLKSPILRVADTKTHRVIGEVGPFTASIRPFTVNAAQTLAFVNVNELLGFEIGDSRTGKVLHRVEVKGYDKGAVKRHGCPSHGIGLTPDEKEVWVCDAHNMALHVFDATSLPPKQTTSIKLREEPGWVTFSLDGKFAYPSTGEIIDTKTKKILTTLKDEKDRPVLSEKVIEIQFENGVPVRNGDQFGVGRAGKGTEGKGTLTVVAGGGTRSDGVPATEAKLNTPFGVGFDAAGNMIVGEYLGHRILKVDPKGVITTIAGTGEKGDSGDGGPAAKAQLNGLHDIIVTGPGDIYIADSLNFKVRKIDGKTGTISTVAGTGKKGYSGDGGPATKADLDGVACLWLEGQKLYLTGFSQYVRVLDLQTGTIDTIKGIKGGRSMAIDGQGNIYVSTARGLSVLGKDGKVRVLLDQDKTGGSGQALGSNPKHLAVDAAGNILIADELNHMIRKYIVAADKLVTIAGTGKAGKNGSDGPADKAEVNRPHGVFVHPSGAIYVSDSFNHRVVKIDP